MLGQGPHQLVNSEEDVVAGDLLKIYDNTRDGLVMFLILLVQQYFFWMIQE